MFTFLGFPVLVACTVLSKELIFVLFGEKWLPAAPFVMITSLAVAFHPFDIVNIQAINALGRSDIYLKLMVIRRLLGVLLIIATVRLGMWQFALAMAIYYGPAGIFINAWPNRKLLGYTIGMQFRDVLPSLMFSVAMACVLMTVVQIPCSPYLLLPVALIVGGISYFALAVLFRYGPMVEVFKVIASIFAKRIPQLSWVCEVMYRRMVK
jgi:O-antigen/teichoic acid export membrane protein